MFLRTTAGTGAFGSNLDSRLSPVRTFDRLLIQPFLLHEGFERATKLRTRALFCDYVLGNGKSSGAILAQSSVGVLCVKYCTGVLKTSCPIFCGTPRIIWFGCALFPFTLLLLLLTARICAFEPIVPNFHGGMHSFLPLIALWSGEKRKQSTG